MVLGALVADAAAMGLHWIYDQGHICTLAPETPEFTTPNAQNYKGVPAYFAHGACFDGDQSQYGAQAMVMLRTLAANAGRYDSATYAEAFRAHFGYGGAYVGYIDHATRDTLDNARRFEDAAQAWTRAHPLAGNARLPKTLVAKAIPLLARHKGDALCDIFEKSVRKSHNDEVIVAYAMELLTALRTLPPITGAPDIQLPAIAKLPALVALLAAQGCTEGDVFDTAIASAVRVTSDHETALMYGEISAHMMAGALHHGTVFAALGAGRAVAPPQAAALLDYAHAAEDRDNAAVTRHFGLACDLPMGVPSAAHNIATATSFTDAVRTNIYSGGDTCGRAILVGAVIGAVHGVGGQKGIPQGWIDRLTAREETDALLTRLFG